MTESIGPARPAPAERLGWRVERRPRPAFAHVLGAAAGAFLVIGVLAFVVEATDDDPTAPGVVFNLLLVAAALLVGSRAPGPIRSASVTALVLAVPLVWAFALFGDSDVGRGQVRGVYLLTLVCYLALYFLTWTKARAIFLAGALLLFASWATFEVADSNSVVPFQTGVAANSNGLAFPGSSSSSSSSSLGASSSSSSSLDLSDSDTDSSAGLGLVIGLAFLAVGAALDRKRYAGAATPFVAVGAIEALGGAIVLGANNSAWLTGVLAATAGAAVGLVGAHGDQRRATTWIGVLAVFGGMVAILVDIAPDSAAGVGGIAFGIALGLGLIAWWLAPVLGEADDGSDEPTPPTAPPGGTAGTALPPAAAA
jgi:hypothetical protein